jgi:hypothetical protein
MSFGDTAFIFSFVLWIETQSTWYIAHKLYQAGREISMEHLVEWELAGESEVLGGNPPSPSASLFTTNPTWFHLLPWNENWQGKGKWSEETCPSQMPVCPPQIPREFACYWTRAAALVGNNRLTYGVATSGNLTRSLAAQNASQTSSKCWGELNW